jgi:transcriptional regulator with XRE-family HTH domain
MRMTVGERIVALRKSMGYTQNELANKVGVSRQTIRNYESNMVEPSLFNATCISEVFKVSLDFLAKGVENDASSEELPLL